MTHPPLHITSLSLDTNGWVVANDAKKSSPHQDDDGQKQCQSHQSIEITPSCRKRLLPGLKLDLSSSLISGNNANNVEDAPGPTPLEELPHNPNLPNLILKVISEIRRLGAPNESALRKQKDGKNGDGESRNQRRMKNRGGRNGKVARMEEQRRLRLKQEQEKLEMQSKWEKAGDQNDQKEGGGDEKDEERKEPRENKQGRVPVSDVSNNTGPNNADPSVDGNEMDETANGIPVEQRLPAVFNTLRILINILRPMLHHPQSQDLSLKMKKGPSVKKESKTGKKHRYYLFTEHVYACVSVGCWNELNREFRNTLHEMQEGLYDKMMSRVEGNEQYELSAKDWVMSLFDHASYMNEEMVTERCMGRVSFNPDVVSKCHDALMARFEGENDQKQNMLQRSIDRLQDKLHAAISRKFNGARLTVYGSCLSGLALEGSHDVDVSIFIPELDRLKQHFDSGKVSAAEYEKKMRRIIYKVRDSLEYCRSRSFAELFAITRARVPVVKGVDIHAQNPYTHDGHLSFDLCFLNDIAVVNSSLLREYSLFDNRVRILMLSVKSFAKQKRIASAADGTLSSYSWLNKVVFYLQCIGFLPVLQCPTLMEEHDFKPDQKGNRWHCINGLETFYLTKDIVARKKLWEQSAHVSNTSTAHLLFGFLNFYSGAFPQQTVAASIRYGKCTLQKTSFSESSKLWRICVEDPFETCNSHCPHDLGCHVKEDGQVRINEEIQRATARLGALLVEGNVCDDEISEFLCTLLGPMPSASNQMYDLEPPPPDKARNTHNHRNPRGKGKQVNQHHNQNQAKSANKDGRQGNERAKNNNGHGANGVSTYMTARSQMKGTATKGSKNDQPAHNKQIKNQQSKHRNRTHGDNHTNGRQPIQHAVDPASDKQFVEKQKEKLHQMSEEKKQKGNPGKKNRNGRNHDNNHALEEKVNKGLKAQRPQSGSSDKQNQARPGDN